VGSRRRLRRGRWCYLRKIRNWLACGCGEPDGGCWAGYRTSLHRGKDACRVEDDAVDQASNDAAREERVFGIGHGDIVEQSVQGGALLRKWC